MSLLGQRLRLVREGRGIAPIQVEIDTRIRSSIIQALERGDYANLPPDPFLSGLIRTYVTYLGADPEEMIGLYLIDIAPQPSPPKINDEKTSFTQPAASIPISSPRTILDTKLTTISSPPPDSLSPPELLNARKSGFVFNIPHISLAFLTKQPLPYPAIIILGIIAILILITCVVITFSQLMPAAFSMGAARTMTPRTMPTRTPTLVPGTGPTSIPTLAATAPPFATIPGNPPSILRTTPNRTRESSAGLNLDVEVTQTVKIWVGIDGVLVFEGQMLPGTSRSWSASESLYVRVENPKDALILFNSRPVPFRVYAERNLIERHWILDAKGTPVSITPATPIPATARSPTFVLEIITPLTHSPTPTPF